MSTSDSTPMQAHVKIDETRQEICDPDTACQAIQNYCAATGKSFVALESSYWGSEAFGKDHWTTQVFANIGHVTEDDDGNPKGVRLENAIDANRFLSFVYQRERAINQLLVHRNGGEPDYEHLTPEYWGEQLEEANRTLNGDYPIISSLGSGWVPASKITFRMDHDGPQNFVKFGSQGREEMVHRGETDVTIEEKTTIRTKYGVYDKLAVDSPYDPEISVKDVNDEYGWDEFHISAKYSGDEFQCWTADPDDPQALAESIARVTGWTVGIKEDLL